LNPVLSEDQLIREFIDILARREACENLTSDQGADDSSIIDLSKNQTVYDKRLITPTMM